MGWNGGGFGHMTFETGDGVAAWKAANVSHDQWTDWTDWFANALDKRFVVADQLTKLRELHDPKGAGYFVLDEQGPKVDFAFDTGEDTVRDFSGTIAACLRSAAEHGARGTFYFLGTAGAEYDFTYKLEIANGHSTMESLHEVEIASVYESDQYQAFLQRVMEGLGITADGEIVEQAGTPPAATDGDDDAEREALKQKAAAFTAAQKESAKNPGAAAPAPKQPAAKTTAAKPAATTTAAKTTAAKPAATTTATKTTAAKPAARTTAAKPTAAKTTAAKPAATTTAAKTTAAKPAAKKPAAKPAAAKPAKKAAAKPAKKAAAKPAKKAAAKPAKKAAAKPAAKKPAAKKPAAKKR